MVAQNLADFEKMEPVEVKWPRFRLITAALYMNVFTAAQPEHLRSLYLSLVFFPYFSTFLLRYTLELNPQNGAANGNVP